MKRMSIEEILDDFKANRIIVNKNKFYDFLIDWTKEWANMYMTDLGGAKKEDIELAFCYRANLTHRRLVLAKEKLNIQYESRHWDMNWRPPPVTKAFVRNDYADLVRATRLQKRIEEE